MEHPAYELSLPEVRTTSTIFASPHSGRNYPLGFLKRSVLDERAIRSSEDAFVDLLVADAPRYGAPLIAATAPRAYVDVNRGAEELDPALIRGVGRAGHNPRVSSGLGVIPRVVAGGREIYHGKISLGEARARLQDHWYPYHERLHALIEESRASFGQALLVDVHSMPHEAVESLCRHRREKPEIVIGDRFGAAASAEIVGQVEDVFRAEGFKVARNTPFAGAYTAQAYGRPSRRSHVIQIEIDRALYMSEEDLQPNANYSAMQRILSRVVGALAEIGRPATERIPLAAE